MARAHRASVRACARRVSRGSVRVESIATCVCVCTRKCGLVGEIYGCVIALGAGPDRARVCMGEWGGVWCASWSVGAHTYKPSPLPCVIGVAQVCCLRRKAVRAAGVQAGKNSTVCPPSSFVLLRYEPGESQVTREGGAVS